MNQVDASQVAHILSLADHNVPNIDEVAHSIAQRHNHDLLFKADEPRMAYSVRDLVINSTIIFPFFTATYNL